MTQWNNDYCMIPKIIHYCWFGGNPLPDFASKCIDSWKRFFPDYEIREWNESNYNVHKIPYISEAYRLKKYAFVSDYCRIDVLYQYGGLYFDTDVEVIKPFDDIINRGPFMGCELAPIYDPNQLQPQEKQKLDLFVNPGLGLGVTPGSHFYKEILDYYAQLHFVNIIGIRTETIVTILTNFIQQRAPNIDFNKITEFEGVYIYPVDYFCPIVALTGEVTITENTRSIHHYTATWAKYSPIKLIRAFSRLKSISVRLLTQFEFFSHLK